MILSQCAHPLVLLALTTGTMAIGRYFGGEFVHKFDQTVLLISAVIAFIGLFLYSSQTGSIAYLAAIIFELESVIFGQI